MRRSVMFLIFVLVVILFLPIDKNNNQFEISGYTMGSIPYSLKYIEDDNIIGKKSIDSLLINFNNIFSTYIKDSEISKLNNSDKKVIKISSSFFKMLYESKKIFNASGGAYDPTIGPVVNAWGFGPDKNKSMPSKNKIDSLLSFVGFDNLEFDNFSFKKPNSGYYLDFSSIAKGYAVDIISDYLNSKGLKNYFIEIGGEVKAAGYKSNGDPWVVGINSPFDDSKLYALSSLSNKSLATSGNYRNFYKSGDSIIFHTIDPRTGYPSESNMISASVFSSSCFSADAYATAFMVLGFERSKQILEMNDEIDGLLIYTARKEGIKNYISPGILNSIDFVE